jgi:hypothetical protein
MERRAETRLWCSELIRVRLQGGRRELAANLEDLSPSGACVLTEEPLRVGAAVVLVCGRRRFRGTVRYSVRHEIGYLTGVRFAIGRKWSREIYEPKHLLDPTRVPPRRSSPGG